MIDDILDELEADTAVETGVKFAAVTARYLQETRRGEGQVSTPHSPEELARRFDEKMPRTGRSIEEVIARIERDVIADANKYCHPMYMGHQTSAPIAPGIWMESVISALNQSLAVQEMSPTATAIEHQLVRWFSDLVGYGAESGGTMTSGGTEANFTALLAARNHALPDAWENGVGEDPPFIVYGEHAHYAVTRAIGQLGLGRRRGIAIPSRDYRMDVDQLVSALDGLVRRSRVSRCRLPRPRHLAARRWRSRRERSPLGPADHGTQGFATGADYRVGSPQGDAASSRGGDAAGAERRRSRWCVRAAGAVSLFRCCRQCAGRDIGAAAPSRSGSAELPVLAQG